MNEEEKEGYEMSNAQFNTILEAIAKIVENAKDTAEAAAEIRKLKTKD